LGQTRLAAGAANLATFDNWPFGIAMCATMDALYECHLIETVKSGRYSKERFPVHDMLGNNDIGDPKAHSKKNILVQNFAATICWQIARAVHQVKSRIY